jgi:hypothetical protein
MSIYGRESDRELKGVCNFLLSTAGFLFTLAILRHWWSDEGLFAWLSKYINLDTQSLILYGITVLIASVAYYGTCIYHVLGLIHDCLPDKQPENK